MTPSPAPLSPFSHAGPPRARAAPLAPYWFLARLTFLKLMAYRMRYLTGIATYAVFVGGQYAIWRAIFAARDQGPGAVLDGLTFAELTTYIAIGYIARAAYFTNTDSEIAARFQSGDVTLDLLKPLSFQGQWLAQAAGETAFRVVFFALPMALVLFPMFGILAPQGPGWWQFPLLFVLAFLINAELNVLAGTMSFFLEDITGLMSLKRNLLMLLSGLLVPLHFLPHLIGETISYLPFALISYYPTMAYVGKIGSETPGIGHVFLLGAVWWLLLRGSNMLLWLRARGRLEVQGG